MKTCSCCGHLDNEHAFGAGQCNHVPGCSCKVFDGIRPQETEAPKPEVKKAHWYTEFER